MLKTCMINLITVFDRRLMHWSNIVEITQSDIISRLAMELD